MTKSDLISMVADKAGLTKADSQRALDGLVEIIAKSLSKGEKVTWTGFGTFEVRQRAARTGRGGGGGAGAAVANALRAALARAAPPAANAEAEAAEAVQLRTIGTLQERLQEQLQNLESRLEQQERKQQKTPSEGAPKPGSGGGRP